MKGRGTRDEGLGARGWRMAEQYSHTLIPRDHSFVPSPTQVQEFFSAILALGVIPANQSIVLRTPSGKTREFPNPNPFTGERIIIELKDHKRLASVSEIADSVAKLTDYEIEVSGEGKPTLPPISVEFEENYFVGVTLFVSSKLISTSDYHQESGEERNAVPYGKPCENIVATGLFNDPHTNQLIEVAGEGCARFWTQFELGKFLFPKIADGNLEILNPAVAKAAKAIFGASFVQGCYWG